MEDFDRLPIVIEKPIVSLNRDQIAKLFSGDPVLEKLKYEITGSYSPLVGCNYPVFSLGRYTTPDERSAFFAKNQEHIAVITEVFERC